MCLVGWPTHFSIQATQKLCHFKYFAQRWVGYCQRGLVCIFHRDSGYSIKECRIWLKKGDEISHDKIIQLWLLWPYPDDHKHLLRIYTHQTKLAHAMNVVLRGSIFAVRLTKGDPKCPGVCSYSFCSTNFTINITKRCMHAKKKRGKYPKACSDVSILLLFTLVKNSNFRLFANEWQATFGNLSQPALNFWKSKVKTAAKLACGLARPGINPTSLLLTSTATDLFIYLFIDDLVFF